MEMQERRQRGSNSSDLQESGGCSREKRSLNKGTKAERYKIYLEEASLEWEEGKAWREEMMADGRWPEKRLEVQTKTTCCAEVYIQTTGSDQQSQLSLIHI